MQNQYYSMGRKEGNTEGGKMEKEQWDQVPEVNTSHCGAYMTYRSYFQRAFAHYAKRRQNDSLFYIVYICIRRNKYTCFEANATCLFEL